MLCIQAMGVEWVVLAAVAVAGASLLAWTLNRDAHIRRRVNKMRLTPMRDVVDGRRVKVSGIVDLPAPPLTAPLSGRPCAAWSVVLQEPAEGWHTVAQESVAAEFSLVDETGMSARVTAGNVEIVYSLDVGVESGWNRPPTERLREILVRHQKELDSFFGRPRRYRALEGVIEHGERVTVVGRARREIDPNPRVLGDPYREPPQRLVLTADHDGPIFILDAPARRSFD